MPAQHPIIGVIVNTVGGYSRGVIRGITSYAFARAWICRVQGVNDRNLVLHNYDGLIVQAATSSQVNTLSRATIPVVNVSSAMESHALPAVVSDDLAVGRMGADYFLRLGFRHFLFFNPDERSFAKLRQLGFSQKLAEANHQSKTATSVAQLHTLLSTPQTPIAIMACNDAAALSVLEVCRDRSMKVPDEVAVLGVDNDDLVQSLAHPPLSTINTARQRIGFEAAAMLEALMKSDQNSRPSASILRIAPTAVIVRQSTDLLAIHDKDVADAVRFIRVHAGRPITVNDVLKELPLSRRQLERRFRQTLGRSILDEIQRCRIDRARSLLVDTELTLPQIALACGFMSASYFNVVFRKSQQIAPGEYRTRFAPQR